MNFKISAIFLFAISLLLIGCTQPITTAKTGLDCIKPSKIAILQEAQERLDTNICISQCGRLEMAYKEKECDPADKLICKCIPKVK